RIDRNEPGADVLALVTELLQPAVELEQRRRADFRAMGEAEEDGRGRAAEGGLGDLVAALVDERERRAEGLAGMLDPIPVEGEPADACRHDHQYADKNGAHHLRLRPWKGRQGLETPGEAGLDQ